MTVHADRDVCIASGLCVLRLPEVFDQDEDDGRVVIRRPQPDPSQLAAVLEAVDACPSGALRTER
jgi:ferredoxin